MQDSTRYNPDRKDPLMNYVIKTSGLMCAHCDATVESALLKVAGVIDADADHTAQTVSVEADASVSTDALMAAVEAAGENFHALSISAA